MAEKEQMVVIQRREAVPGEMVFPEDAESLVKEFDSSTYDWTGVPCLQYKEDNSPFKAVSRRVLFDGALDIPCQFRYFEVAPGGYSTLEHHEHTHMVMIFRGKGQCLLGKTVLDVKMGDFIEIPSHVVHQFRANKGDYIGFLCLVNQDRDKVTVVSEAEIEVLKGNAAVKAFLES